MRKQYIGALLVLLLSACSEQLVEDKMVFHYNEPEGITSLDPAYARNLENIWAVDQLFDGLVRMAPDLSVQPCVAERWEISSDGLEYTFYLRDDVFFHPHAAFAGGQGRKVTADDFVRSFQRIMDPATASPGAWIFQHLDGTRTADGSGLVAMTDQILRIYIKEPFPPFLGLLTMAYASVVPMEVVHASGRNFGEAPIGAGPFKFSIWRHGVKLALLRNECYYERDAQGDTLPYLDAVTVSFVKDRNAAFLDLMKGNLDLISGLEGNFKDQILEADGSLKAKYQEKFSMARQPWMKTDYLGIQMDTSLEAVRNSPLADLRVRQAINYALDRDKIVQYIMRGIGRPANSGFVPFGMPSFDPDAVPGYHFDPEKAKALLREAGYPNGTGLPSIELSTTSSYVDLCEFVQGQLAEIGIDLRVDVLPLSSHKDGVANGELLFFRKSWLADYPDAENFLLLFQSDNFAPGGPNYCHFRSALFDDLYTQARSEVRDSVRYRLYQRMDSLVMAQAAVVPLYYPETVRFIRNEVRGLGSDPMNMLDLRQVRKD